MSSRRVATRRRCPPGLAIVVAIALDAGLAALISPAWLGGVIAVAVATAGLVRTHVRCPSALAVCLLPQIAVGTAWLPFVGAVAAVAALMVLAGAADRLLGWWLDRRHQTTTS
jgi:hypothetical protein